MYNSIRTSHYLHYTTRLVSTSSVIRTPETMITEPKAIPQNKQLGAESEDNSRKPVNWEAALPYEELPGPKALPIIGNIWRFFPYIGDLHNLDVLNMHIRFHQQYGNIMALKGIPYLKDTVIIFSPEDFEVVHRNEGVYPIRDALKAFAYYRQVVRKNLFQDVTGLSTVHGTDWYNMRSKVNPILMHPQTALQYVESMDYIANDFIATIRNLANSNSTGEMPTDFINYIYRWTLESVCFIALDKRLGCLDLNLKQDSEQQKVINSVLEMFNLYYKLEVQPTLWQVYNSKSFQRFTEVMDYMTLIFLKYVNEAKEKLSTKYANRDEHASVFQQLLKIDSKVAFTMALDMLTAGVDTTGKVTSAALYYLAKNPEIQSKLREELTEILPHKDSPVNKDAFANSHYLNAVVKEILRIAPIAVGNFRAAGKDMIICGYQIPKGTNILTSNLFLCHSNKYFPKAKEFIPERWLRSNNNELSHKNSHPFVYLPFGFGPRSCIGKRLATLEIKIGLAKIIRNFYLEWHHEDMIFQSMPLYGIAKPLKLTIKEVEY